MYIILDSFPASSTSKRENSSPTESDRCRRWIDECELAGHNVMVPAVVYYEVLRELELRQAHSQIARFKKFSLHPARFIALLSVHLETAAQLWAQSRRAGKPTSDPKELDVDVILAAQALNLNLATSDFIIATTNPGHLSRFVPAELWSKIVP